jgi:hypothetical protein
MHLTSERIRHHARYPRSSLTNAKFLAESYVKERRSPPAGHGSSFYVMRARRKEVRRKELTCGPDFSKGKEVILCAEMCWRQIRKITVCYAKFTKKVCCAQSHHLRMCSRQISQHNNKVASDAISATTRRPSNVKFLASTTLLYYSMCMVSG